MQPMSISFAPRLRAASNSRIASGRLVAMTRDAIDVHRIGLQPPVLPGLGQADGIEHGERDILDLRRARHFALARPHALARGIGAGHAGVKDKGRDRRARPLASLALSRLSSLKSCLS